MLFDEAAFVVEAALALLAAARVGAGLSLLELEFCEVERAFSPLADEEVSDLLFDLRERLSAGIFRVSWSEFPAWSSGEHWGPRYRRQRKGEMEDHCPKSGDTGMKDDKSHDERSQRSRDTGWGMIGDGDWVELGADG